MSFLQYFCLFHNAEAQVQELSFLSMKGFVFKSGLPQSAAVHQLGNKQWILKRKLSTACNGLMLKIALPGSLANLINAGDSSQGWLNEMLSIILLLITIRSKTIFYL